jgi:hypothetical protein
MSIICMGGPDGVQHKLFKFVSIGHRIGHRFLLVTLSLIASFLIIMLIMKHNNVRSLDVASSAYQESNYGDFQLRKAICLQRM